MEIRDRVLSWRRLVSIALLATLVLSMGAPGVSATTNSGGKTLIKGKIQFEDRDGNLQPARQVKIRLVKRGALSKEIATLTTNDKGVYKTRIDVSNWENDPFNQKLKFKVQALAKNPAAEILAFKNNFKLGQGNGRTYLVQEKDKVKVGTGKKTIDINISNREKRRVFQIADWALDARRFTGKVAGWKRKKRVKIKYPAAGDRYFSTIDKIKISNETWNRKHATVYHEYGHSVMGGLFGYSGWKIPHIKTWLKKENEGWFPCHTVYSETGKHYAWYEGFAEFTEAAVNGSPTTDGMDLENNTYYNMDRSHPDCHDGDAGPDYDGKKVEGAVASILWDLYDGKNEAHDEIQVPLREIFATVSKKKPIKSSKNARNKAKAKSVNEFWNQFENKQNHEELRKIFFVYGIQKPDRFENNDKISSASRLNPNTSTDAQLNYGDADNYVFKAEKEERVNISLTRQHGDSDLEMVVYGPSGSPVARSTVTGNPNETLAFTAPKKGDYNIWVQDFATKFTAAMYTLDLGVQSKPRQDLEDNDDKSSAASIDSSVSGSWASTNNKWYHGGVIEAGIAKQDPDYYSIKLEKGEHIRASVTDTGLDVSFLDKGGSEVGSTGTTGTRNYAKHTASADSKYYIKVSADKAEVVQKYYLHVTDTKPEGYDRLENDDSEKKATVVQKSEYDDLRLAGSDDDYFAVDLEKGDSLNATIEYQGDGPANIEAVGPNNFVDYGYEPNALTRRSSGTSEKRVDFTAPKAGTYYVHVYGSIETTQKYNITILRNGKTDFTSVGNAGTGDGGDGNGIRIPDPERVDEIGKYRYIKERLDDLGLGGDNDGPCKVCDTGMPGWVAGNERVNIRVDGPEKDLVYHAEIEDGKIVKFSKSALDNPTVEVSMDAETMKSLVSTEKPVDTFKTKYAKGEIKVKGVGLANKIKFGIARAGTSLHGGITGIGGTITDLGGGAIDGATDVVGGVADGVGDAVSGFVDGVSGLMP